MKVAQFIKYLAKSLNDPNFVLFKDSDWKEIIEFMSCELAPDIRIFKTSECLINSQFQIDLSGPEFDGILGVDRVVLETSSGLKVPYDTWTYDDKNKILSLDPKISYEVTFDKDPQIAKKIYVTWYKTLDNIVSEDDELELPKTEFWLFKEICLVEALSRILMDQIKLERYRTLNPSVPVYQIQNIINNKLKVIEYRKLSLRNQNKVQTF